MKIREEEKNWKFSCLIELEEEKPAHSTYSSGLWEMDHIFVRMRSTTVVRHHQTFREVIVASLRYAWEILNSRMNAETIELSFEM